MAQKLGRSRALIERWSVSWQWVFRAEQYDAHEDARRRKVLIESEISWRERVQAFARTALVKLMQRLEGDPEAGIEPLPSVFSTMRRPGVYVRIKRRRLVRQHGWRNPPLPTKILEL